MIGVSATYLCLLEKNIKKPTLRLLIEMAFAFNISITDLIILTIPEGYFTRKERAKFENIFLKLLNITSML